VGSGDLMEVRGGRDSRSTMTVHGGTWWSYMVSGL